MSAQTSLCRGDKWFPTENLKDIPILYEDEYEEDMGESNPHVETDEILHVCIKAHLSGQPGYRVFSNMNLYYLPEPSHERTGSRPNVSPDIMVVVPFQNLGEEVSSYTIGEDGPAPESVTEILSERSAQERDLKEKTVLYAQLGIGEYLLVDPTGKYLPERLLLKRLQPDGTYRDEKDPDGGVTSRLGFRLIFDSDGKIRVLDGKTGRAYVRPEEAQVEAAARHEAEEKLRAALQQIKLLQEQLDKKKKKGRALD